MKRSAGVGMTLLLLSACSTGGGFSAPPPGPAETPDPNTIVIGSFSFTESRIVAHIYALALREKGLKVDIETDVGPREVLGPALEQGLVDIVPDYLGTALQFMSIGRADPSPSTVTTHERLSEELERRGLEVLAPSRAQDQNGFVVRPATASELDLETLSDLEPIAKTCASGARRSAPQDRSASKVWNRHTT